MTEPALLEVRSPVSGEVIGRYSVADEAEVARALARARCAFARWGRVSLDERLAAVRRLRRLIVGELDAIVEAISLATGKPRLEALSGDLLTCVEAMQYYERHAARALADQPRRGGLMFGLATFHVEHAPIGVVAVFSPWNYPLQLALVPTVTALVAGNTVLLKPSEITPTVGALVGDLCERAGIPEGVVQVLQGGPEVGERLIRAGPDKIFFTGSVATGKRVMRAAAERQSGFGRYHGPEGLRALSRIKAVMVTNGSLGHELNWFPHTAAAYEGLRTLVRLLYGGGGGGAASRARQILEGLARLVRPLRGGGGGGGGDRGYRGDRDRGGGAASQARQILLEGLARWVRPNDPTGRSEQR